MREVLYKLVRTYIRPKVCYYPQYPRVTCDCVGVCKFPPPDYPTSKIKISEKKIRETFV